MKTEEDEAFDELAKRQGAWGGGYQAKRKMAADKLQEPVHSVQSNGRHSPLLTHMMNKRTALAQPAPGYCKNCKDYTIEEPLYAQPAQEPVNLLDARRIATEYGTPGSQVDDGNLYFALSKCLEHIDAQPAQEPVARVTGVYGGRFTYEPINPAMILPVGMALYAGPA